MNQVINGAIIGAVAAGTGIAAVVSVPRLLLTAVGFGKGGVVAGSIAARIQSWIGNVPADSLFSNFQRAGAVGIPTPINAVIELNAGAVEVGRQVAIGLHAEAVGVGVQVAANILGNNDAFEEENDSENEDDDNMGN